MRVAAELRKFAGPASFQVKTASDLPTVRQILKTKTVDAVIIEVGMETGDALTVLRLLHKDDQGNHFYVYNGFMLPRIAEKVLEYSHVQYCEDHKNLDQFIAIILSELNRKSRGIIHGIALGNFLQLLNSEKFDGQIIVTTGDKKGILFLRAGRLIRADMNGSNNNTTLAEMSSWEKVTVEIREEGHAGASGDARPPKGEPLTEKVLFTADLDRNAGSGHIDILCFTGQGRKITVNIKKLNSAIREVQDLLGDSLLKMDIFLSVDGRSLAGWNSQHLACSNFAAITHAVSESLKTNDFPLLQNYYLFDTGDEHTILVIIKDELQWGFLLKRAKARLGLLLNIILPKALAILEDTVSTQRTV